MPVSQALYDLTQPYRTARLRLPGAATLVLLHLGAEQTGVAVGHGYAPSARMVLNLGSQKTARDFFKHTPPSPLELENAIATVEDEVTRARTMVSPGATLCTTDLAIGEIALLSGVTAGHRMRLSLEAMERSFERLVQVSLGRPASLEALPDSPGFAATLLILREFMHHLQWTEITILDKLRG